MNETLSGLNKRLENLAEARVSVFEERSDSLWDLVTEGVLSREELVLSQYWIHMMKDVFEVVAREEHCSPEELDPLKINHYARFLYTEIKEEPFPDRLDEVMITIQKHCTNPVMH